MKNILLCIVLTAITCIAANAQTKKTDSLVNRKFNVFEPYGDVVTDSAAKAKFKADSIAKAKKQRKFQLAINLGGGFTSIASTSSYNSTPGRAIFGSVAARFIIKKIFIQPELGLTRQEWKYRPSNTTSNFNNTYANSIDVPVLLGYQFGGKKLKATVVTGPMASFFFNKDVNYSSYFFNMQYNPSEVLRFKSQAYSWVGGGGLSYKRLSLDARYIYGLNNFSASGYNQSLNRVNLSLGFRVW